MTGLVSGGDTGTETHSKERARRRQEMSLVAPGMKCKLTAISNKGRKGSNIYTDRDSSIYMDRNNSIVHGVGIG